MLLTLMKLQQGINMTLGAEKVCISKKPVSIKETGFLQCFILLVIVSEYWSKFSTQ